MKPIHAILIHALLLIGCGLPTDTETPLEPEPEEEPFPSGYVRACLSLDPAFSDPRDCVGLGCRVSQPT